MFQILDVETGAPVSSETFVSAEIANGAAKVLREAGKRVRIAVAVDNSWRDREQSRFDSGKYQHLPDSWINAPWFYNSQAARDHYAHRSEDGKRIAFTESPEKGMADRQLVLDPGKYLARYFADRLTDEEIKRLALGFNAAPVVLRFANTPDEIEFAYADQNVSAGGTSGRSCMSYEADHYSSPCHPARMYGAGDLAVAYTTAQDDDATVTARVLCWPEKRKYTRLYGKTDRDVSTLREMLETEGYRYAGALKGARLIRKEYQGGFVVPYVDGDIQTLGDNGRYLVIDSDGDIDATGTDGLVEGDSIRCDCCGSRVSGDDYYCVGDDRWCYECYSEHGMYCDNCGEDYDARYTDFHHIANKEVNWCEHCANRLAVKCDHCDEWHTTRGMGHCDVENGGDTETWCENCVESHATRCEHCETYYASDECGSVITDADGDTECWCADCIGKDAVKCSECQQLFSDDLTESGICEGCREDEPIRAMDRDESTACANDARQIPLPL